MQWELDVHIPEFGRSLSLRFPADGKHPGARHSKEAPQFAEGRFHFDGWRSWSRKQHAVKYQFIGNDAKAAICASMSVPHTGSKLTNPSTKRAIVRLGLKRT